MAASLRARLWLSYAVLILVLLCSMGSGIVVSLFNSPWLYRQDILRMQLTEAATAQLLSALPMADTAGLDQIIQDQASQSDFQLAIYSPSGAIVASSGQENLLPNLTFPLQNVASNSDQLSVKSFIDVDRRVRFYTMQSLRDGYYLLVETPRPRGLLLAFFGSELFTPILISGIFAFLVMIIVGLLMDRWISKPLNKMKDAARSLAVGNYQVIPVEGPQEIQQLAQSLNEMGKQVRESSQSQRDFVSNVSHELKTPLTSIQGFAQAIMDGTAQTPEALHRAAEVIYKEAGRMSRLVLDLLTLARLEAGTADLQKSGVDLNELLKNVVDKFALQAQQNQVSLEWKEQHLPTIIGDGDRLAQVFTNIIDNALKFTSAGGRITLSAVQKLSQVIISIADTGAGIAPQDQKRIFERFYQVDKSRQARVGRGVGLGLPIARQIVLAHGGDIWVESQPGKGSTFMVRLPVARSDDTTLQVKMKDL
ncbi:MAG TPA: HAMP domain-containing sensor histidine kinase [Longilinea sp.]|nr:HAMP domain-containing sensor histidine kinase [Longilinea sp.]